MDVFWVAAGLMLLFEGLTPFVSPAAWRRMLLSLASLSDAGIRRLGFFFLVAGMGLLWWLQP